MTCHKGLALMLASAVPAESLLDNSRSSKGGMKVGGLNDPSCRLHDIEDHFLYPAFLDLTLRAF